MGSLWDHKVDQEMVFIALGVSKPNSMWVKRKILKFKLDHT